MDPIRILIVDDVEDIREHFAMILSREPDFEIVGMAATGTQAVTMAEQLEPDVVLMDVHMETPTAGIDATSEIHLSMPDIKIIILTIHEEDELLFQAYCAGAMDYIIKTDSFSYIVTSIRNVYENKMMLRPHVAEKIVKELTRMKAQQTSFLFAMHLLSELTNSEFEILRLVYEGHGYKEIAASRFVSLATIKSQVNSILKKFERKSMRDVVRMLEQINFDEIIRDRQGRG